MSLGEARLAILIINMGINWGNVKSSEEPFIHVDTCAPLPNTFLAYVLFPSNPELKRKENTFFTE